VHQLIASHHNPKIRSLLSLEKPRERKKQCLFIIEGKKEIGLAIRAGYRVGNLFFCENLIRVEEVMELGLPDKALLPVTRDVFERIAVRENTGGVIAVAEQKTHRLDQLQLSVNPLLLVLESVEKPGNLGAILRTADAAGLDAVVICDPQTDLYNPNVIRSSVGCIFTTQIASVTSEEAIAWLTRNQIRFFCTSLNASTPYYEQDFTKACAVVMGTESQGLSSLWTTRSHGNVIIPMAGMADSMNVSTAAAVVVFEATRQRRFIAK
jgi:TrmH family RNA methyltransferase